MLTVIVEFCLPASIPAAAFEQLCHAVAPDYLKHNGLIRKYFLIAEDGRSGGGVYLWQNRDAADRFYQAGFRQLIRENFGSEPKISYFQTPVIADSLTGLEFA